MSQAQPSQAKPIGCKCKSTRLQEIRQRGQGVSRDVPMLRGPRRRKAVPFFFFLTLDSEIGSRVNANNHTAISSHQPSINTYPLFSPHLIYFPLFLNPPYSKNEIKPICIYIYIYILIYFSFAHKFVFFLISIIYIPKKLFE